MDFKTTRSYWKGKTNPYIINQLKLRGFENVKEWDEIRNLQKAGLLKMVMGLLFDDKW